MTCNKYLFKRFTTNYAFIGPLVLHQHTSHKYLIMQLCPRNILSGKRKEPYHFCFAQMKILINLNMWARTDAGCQLRLSLTGLTLLGPLSLANQQVGTHSYVLLCCLMLKPSNSTALVSFNFMSPLWIQYLRIAPVAAAMTMSFLRKPMRPVWCHKRVTPHQCPNL